MHRRLFLLASAGATSSVWLGPAGATPSAAADPWAAWSPEALRGHADPRLRAIAHALLAPNPQNLQPWVCEFPAEHRIVLRVAQERRLPVSDFPDRQLGVGLGCFGELLVLALEAEGYAVETVLYPEGEPWPYFDQRPVAIFSLRQAPARRDPLLDQILRRHTNRTPFDAARAPLAAQTQAIRAVARRPEQVYVSHDPQRAARIRDITLRAWDEEMVVSEPTRVEVARWTKIGNAAIAAAPYGPAMGDAVVAKAAGPITLQALSDPRSAVFQANRANYRRAVETGQVHLWITSAHYDRKGMFEAGRDWVRVQLKATELGLHMQPHSQALHDFAAIDPYVRALHAALGVDRPARIQMLGIGRGTDTGHSPRAGAGTVLQATGQA